MEKSQPTEQELPILVDNLKRYFAAERRSEERKQIVNETFEKLNAVSPDKWDTIKIRLWLNNNKSKYVPES